MRQIGLVLVVAACAHDVSQHRSTGPDGWIKGAKPLALENGEAKAHGIVTYPGGDRVDWKVIELPAGKQGALDLKLTWQAPRPGLQVAFDVFDQWNTPVVATKAAAVKRGRTRSARIGDARGKYFVRVFAPQRGDAGEYKLVASFQTDDHPPPDLTVPDPPKLPAVPDVEPECDVFDVKVKACAKVCPEFGAPPGWKACADRDRAEKVKAEREQAEKDRIEREKNAPKPFVVTIKFVEVQGSDGANITLPIGSKASKVDTTWTGEVLAGDTGKPLAGGSVKIIRVGETRTVARVRLTVDQLNANPHVRLSPPSDLVK